MKGIVVIFLGGSFRRSTETTGVSLCIGWGEIPNSFRLRPMEWIGPIIAQPLLNFLTHIGAYYTNRGIRAVFNQFADKAKTAIQWDKDGIQCTINIIPPRREDPVVNCHQNFGLPAGHN